MGDASVAIGAVWLDGHACDLDIHRAMTVDAILVDYIAMSFGRRDGNILALKVANDVLHACHSLECGAWHSLQARLACMPFFCVTAASRIMWHDAQNCR